MKYSSILVVVFAALSNTEPKPSSLYHVGKLGQVVPVLVYRTPGLLEHRHNRRCFGNNTLLTNCPTSSQNLPYTRRSATNIDTNQSILNSNEKPKHKKINAGHGKTEILKELLAIINKKNPFMLEKPIMNISKYLPMLIEKIKSETVEAKETKSREPNTIDVLFVKEETTDSVPTKASLSEKADTLENSFQNAGTMENLTKSDNTVETWFEIEKTLNPSIENAEAASDFVENNILTTQENVPNLDRECTFNASIMVALDQFEQKLYTTNFNKFLTLAPAANVDNGMSFVQSGLFLGMSLMALSTEVDIDTKNEIDRNLGVCLLDSEKIEIIKQVMLSLPNSSEELKYYRSSRLVLRPGKQLRPQFTLRTAEALQLKIGHFEEAQTPNTMAGILNTMIEKDSDGAIRDTFDEEDFTENEEAVMITTLYFRARWRSDPTLLNGTWNFRDTSNTPTKTVRMIRVKDIMKYVDLPEWDAEAIEMSYLTQGLSLLMIVPRGSSLKILAEKMTSANLTSVFERMQNIRIAVSLPLYTLRMTLLLPNKLQAMKISRIVDVSGAQNGSLRISQAVQRIMFWAEAGRNAYKDDGLEWGAPSEMKIVIDRPYIFFVRWKKINLMVGNFAL